MKTKTVVVLLAVGLVVAGADLIAAKIYWGYAFSPPDLPSVLAPEAIDHLDAITRLTADDGSHVPTLTELRAAPMGPGLRSLAPILAAAAASGLPSRAVAPTVVSSVEAYLRGSGRLDRGDPPYRESSRRLESGLVVEFTAAGAAYVFAAFATGQVSNDHFAVHELLFTAATPPAPLRLRDHARFYYDFAGLEGLEGPRLIAVAPFLVASLTSALVAACQSAVTPRESF